MSDEVNWFALNEHGVYDWAKAFGELFPDPGHVIVEAERADFIAREILPSIEACAEAARNTGGSFLITLQPPGLVESEVVEVVSSCFGPSLPKIDGEAVRVHFNSTNESTASRMLKARLAALIEPFIEGAGHVRVNDTEEGVVVIRLASAYSRG